MLKNRSLMIHRTQTIFSIRTRDPRIEYRFGIIPTRVSSVSAMHPQWLSPSDRRTSHECIMFVSSHLRGAIESIYVWRMHVTSRKSSFQKDEKLLGVFEDLNKRHKGQSSFRSFCTSQTTVIVFARLTSARDGCVTKRNRVSSSRETNKHFGLTSAFYLWREQRTGKTLSDCTIVVPNQNQA